MLYIRQLYLGLTEMVGWWLDKFLDNGWERDYSSIMSAGSLQILTLTRISAISTNKDRPQLIYRCNT